MRIQFTKDYQVKIDGLSTRTYPKGSVHDFDDKRARYLVKQGVAIDLSPSAPTKGRSKVDDDVGSAE